MKFFLGDREVKNYEIVFKPYPPLIPRVIWKYDSKKFYTLIISNYSRFGKEIFYFLMNVLGENISKSDIVVGKELDTVKEGFYRVEYWQQKNYIESIPFTILSPSRSDKEKFFLGIEAHSGWLSWDELYEETEETEETEDYGSELVCFRFETNAINPAAAFKLNEICSQKTRTREVNSFDQVANLLFSEWRTNENKSVIIGKICVQSEIFQYLAMEYPITLGKRIDLVQLVSIPNGFRVHFQAEDSSSRYKIVVLTSLLQRLHRLMNYQERK